MAAEVASSHHVHQYRQWVVSTSDIWDGELEYAETMIARDLRNNSAWNFRMWLMSNRGLKSNDKLQLIKQELSFTFGWIYKAPNNESPWVYAKGCVLMLLYCYYQIIYSGSSAIFSSAGVREGDQNSA